MAKPSITPPWVQDAVQNFAHRKNPDALFYIGIIHARNGNTAKAKICFTQALRIFPLHIRSHHALGKVALMEGDHDEAYERFIRVLKIAGNYPVWGDTDFIGEAQGYIRQHPESKKEDSPAFMYNI